MRNRWERLLESRPVPLLEALLEEVAKLLSRDLARWPLPIEGVDALTAESFAELLSPEYPRPGDEVFREAFQLARWELARELDAFDDYMRNRRYEARGVPSEQRTALLFIGRWLLEQALALNEATEGRVKRPALMDCLTRAERRLFQAPP